MCMLERSLTLNTNSSRDEMTSQSELHKAKLCCCDLEPTLCDSERIWTCRKTLNSESWLWRENTRIILTDTKKYDPMLRTLPLEIANAPLGILRASNSTSVMRQDFRQNFWHAPHRQSKLRFWTGSPLVQRCLSLWLILPNTQLIHRFFFFFSW